MTFLRAVSVAALAATAIALVPAAVAAKPNADLRVAKLGAPPAEVEHGAAFSISGRVANDGDRDAPATVRFSLRRGPDPGPLGIRLRARRVDEVPAGGSARFVHSLDVPSDTAPGEYGLAACVRKRGGTGPLRCESAARRLTVTGPRVVTGEDSGPADPPPGGGSGPSDPGTPPAQFTPGARSLGDSLFPQIGNGGYDALHYEVVLDFNPLANVLNEATTTMTARATQNLSEFSLDFQGLTVDAVRVGGQPASFSRDGTKLIVKPASGIPQGSQFEAEVDYSGMPSEVTDPDNSKEGWIHNSGPTLDGAYTVNQPIGSQGWFPNNNHPADKAAYDFQITVPATHTALGTGELVEPAIDNGDGTRTWHWREDDPTSSYLTTATSGLFNFSQQTINGSLLEYRAIDSSYSIAEALTINGDLNDIAPMTTFLSELYGPYPFDSTGAVVDAAPALGYALENQTKPHFPTPTSASGDILLHELAHQWMGDSVTLANWTDIWFNEGWAQWSEWCWADEPDADCPTTPVAQFDAEYADGSNDWGIAPAELDGDPANLFANFPTYVRGAMTIEGYREIVGQAKFLELTARLNTDFRHGNISTREFIDLANEVSGFTGAELQRLEDYFQQWLYGETKPTITPDNF